MEIRAKFQEILVSILNGSQGGFLAAKYHTIIILNLAARGGVSGQLGNN